MKCGDALVHAYNDDILMIQVQIDQFEGDLAFDASRSDFTIENITARDDSWVNYSSDQDHDGILTIRK